ncbi:hypothetical protein ABK040_013610 [Willaertia magna]
MNEIDTTILKLRENLGGSSIIKPARLYVMETLNECLISDINNKLRKKITSNKKKRIYLFNDMLLIVRKGKYDGHVYFKNIYNTENSTNNNNNKNNINNKNTTINNNNNLNYKIPWIYYDRDVNKNTIEIVTEEITYLVQFNTAIECNEWIDKLNQNTCCNQSNVKELRASRYIHSKIRKIINEEIKIYLDFENEEYIMGYDSKENTTFKFLKKDNFIRDITIEEEHSSIGTESIDELSFDDLSQTTTTSSYKDNTDNFLNDKEFVMPSNSILLQFGLANSNNSNHNMLNKRRNSLSDFSKLKDEDDEEEELYGEEVDELSSDLDSPKNHYKNHHQNGNNNNHRQSVDDKKTTTTNANTNTTTTTTTITKKKEAKTTSGFLSNLLSPKFNYSKSHNDVSQTTNTTVANNNNNLTSNNNNGDDAPLLRNNITSPREHDTVTSNNENVNNIGTSNTHKPPMYGMMPMLPIIPHEILEKQLRKETNPYTFTNNNIVGNNEPSKKLPITPTNRTIRSATHTPSTTTSPYSIISTSTTTSPYNVISNSFNNNNNNTFINNNANNNANNNTSITNNTPLTPTTTNNSNTTNNINPFVTTTTTKNSVNMAVIANRAITKESTTTTTNNNNNQTLQPRPFIPPKPKSLQASPYEDNTNTASPMSLNNNNGNPYSSSPNPYNSNNYNNSPNPYSPVNVSNVNTNNNHNSTTMKPIERQLSNNSLRVKSLPSNETKPIVSPEMELIRSIEERKKLLKAPPPQEKKVDDKPVWMTELKNSKLASKLKEMQDKNK